MAKASRGSHLVNPIRKKGDWMFFVFRNLKTAVTSAGPESIGPVYLNFYSGIACGRTSDYALQAIDETVRAACDIARYSADDRRQYRAAVLASSAFIQRIT